jgi:hypothetical protein
MSAQAHVARWWHGRLTGYVVAAVLVAQVVVPSIALLDEPPTRFGFQMYSAQGGVTVRAQEPRGEPVDVDLPSVVAGPLRPSSRTPAALPERLCAATPGAVQVTVAQPENTRSVRCD